MCTGSVKLKLVLVSLQIVGLVAPALERRRCIFSESVVFASGIRGGN